MATLSELQHERSELIEKKRQLHRDRMDYVMGEGERNAYNDMMRDIDDRLLKLNSKISNLTRSDIRKKYGL